MKNLRNAFCLLVLSLICCKKPFNPTVIAAPNSYLVVEGQINSGSDSTIIKLSQTVNLDNANPVNPVLGAVVTVESDQNNTYPLADLKGDGNYSTAGLNLPASQKYRLRIKTGDGHQYLSDFVEVKPTPPIDSIGYIIQNDGLQLYVNAHDPANNTHYYRWEYKETWIFHAKYKSDYVLNAAGDAIVPRDINKSVYFCFANDSSSNILLSSTAKLSQDIVYQSPLTKIPSTSEKIEMKYSILVKQYALTPDAYSFYTNLKKNTEQLGSIFDAQPSQLVGNIHSVSNVNEPVIGYITATNAQSKRIFINYNVLPKTWFPTYPFDCEEDEALFSNSQGYNEVQNVLIDPPLVYVPTRASGSPPSITGYYYSRPDCVDCTLRGTTVTPSFWK